MVLRYWGERGIDAEAFAPLVDRSAAGIRTTALTADLRGRGWMVVVLDDAQPVEAQLSSGRPVIALIEDRPGTYHYVVVVGTTARAVVFHDPARAPFRVMIREEFDRRSRRAGRWMAIVLPGTRQRQLTAPTPAPAAASSCDQLVADGVAQAQAGDLAAAERTLTSSLSCPGAAPLRELAGVRFLQRRWDDVVQLADQAAAIDSGDAYTWKLLGTSRFLLNQPLAALEAWNRTGEPRLDLIRVDGLERTRQRPVERMLGVNAGQVLTPASFLRAQRSVRELPAASTTGLEIVPAGQGLVELHATVGERSLVPDDVWSWAVIAARAAVSRTVGVTLGSLTGGGESLGVEWRYWPGRPAVFASLRAPAAWPGTWGADLSIENQEFDSGEPESRRRGGRLVATHWLTPAVRLEMRGGADRWNSTGTHAVAGMSAQMVSGAERVAGMVAADGWFGGDPFQSLRVNLTASTARSGAAGELGLHVSSSAGAASVSDRTPLELWPASDTGQVGTVLARAHPLLDDGRIRIDRLGRQIAHASGEVQYWWKGPVLSRIGASAFVDSVRTMARRSGGAVGDVDVGGGVSLTSLLAPGRIRLDYAHGLRDGADALTIRYVGPAW